ncbi:MAG: MoaD/ThiS family protein [Candidatus Thermoplasmatota archaeon]|jgi:MoaD family protein|nr:MoaD/ThiS family protein [Candidatus Thermoplasmatota archaeon]
MKIKVKFFASLRRIVGLDELEMEFNEGTKIDQVVESLKTDFPELEKPMKFTVISLNHKYARGERILEDGDELTLLPPIAGG